MTTVDNCFAVAGTPSPTRRAVDPDERDHSQGSSASTLVSHPTTDMEPQTPRARIRDKVDVSSKAEAFSHALEVARETPHIRTALVAEMRDLVASGTIGQDVYRLATKLIDSLDDLRTSQLRTGRVSYPRLVPSRR